MVDRKGWPKYALARSVIFRHLARNLSSNNGVIFKRFTSFTDDEFVQYLSESGTYFVMCHDGTMSNAAGPIPPLHPNSRQDLQAHEEDQMLLCETKELASSLSAGRHRKLNFRAMILWFMGRRYNVALINELHCADSKVCRPVLLSHCMSL
jgi:hypothetical protein